MNKFSIKNEFSFKSRTEDSSKFLEELFRRTKSFMYRISETAPSDNDLEVLIQNQGDLCLVSIRLLSKNLNILEESLAKSPLVAIEMAAKKVLDKVMAWSELRKSHLETPHSK